MFRNMIEYDLQTDIKIKRYRRHRCYDGFWCWPNLLHNVVGPPPLTMIPVKIDGRMMFTETWRRVRRKVDRMIRRMHLIKT